MSLRSGGFGDGGKWTFGDDGAPIGITTSDKSMAGAVADALGAAPEQLAWAVDHAKKLTDTLNGIQDAAAEREKAAAERDLATAKARLELLGVNATAEDAAAVSGRAGSQAPGPLPAQSARPRMPWTISAPSSTS